MSVSPGILLSELRPDELEEASDLLGRAYRDNPEDQRHRRREADRLDAAGAARGAAMVAAFCELLDAEHVPGFLETDLEKNARLFARFGFETIDHADVLGLPMWFMWRPAS